MKWAVYDTATCEVEFFEKEDEAKDYYKANLRALGEVSVTVETVYLMKVKEEADLKV